MYTSEAINRLLANVRAQMNSVSDVILTSELSLEDYRHNQGIVRGLALAERAILDMTNAAEQGDNDEGT